MFTLDDEDSGDFTDEDDDKEEEEESRQRRGINLNTTPSKNKLVAPLETTPKHHRRGPSPHNSVSKGNPSFAGASSARLTPPVSAMSRRSPGGLVTPPMTPDEMGEDEVFSYDLSRDDSNPKSSRRAFDVSFVSFYFSFHLFRFCILLSFYITFVLF